MRAVDSGQHSLTVQEAGGSQLVVAYEDETLREALVKMLQHKVGRLPVVNRSDLQRAVGYLGRAEILTAQSLEVREPGWIERRFARAETLDDTSSST